MKLIDLLLRELPKRGGWPKNADFVVQDCSGEQYIKFGTNPVEVKLNSDTWQGSWHYTYSKDFKCDELSHDWETAIVTRDQYQSALASSQRVEWSGDGLPPVGCECEYTLSGNTWWPCKVDMYVGTQGVVMSCDVFEGIQYVNRNEYTKLQFRPLHSEADNKRDAAIKQIIEDIGLAQDNVAEAIYDAGYRKVVE